jgi:hypothetical protein
VKLMQFMGREWITACGKTPFYKKLWRFKEQDATAGGSQYGRLREAMS